MTIKQLSGYVGSNVEITFYDGKTKKGVLGYSKEFSAKYGYRKVGYFYIDNLCFKVSHIKKLHVIPRRNHDTEQ